MRGVVGGGLGWRWARFLGCVSRCLYLVWVSMSVPLLMPWWLLVVKGMINLKSRDGVVSIFPGIISKVSSN